MVFNNSILLGAGGQGGAATFDSTLISNSIWLDGSADFLSRQNGSDFANRKEVTVSFWVQKNKFASQQAIFAGVEGGQGFIVQFMSGDTFQLHLNGTANLTTNAVFRDIGWYHILVSIDTSQAIASARSKVYINGEQITSFSSAAYPSQNSNIPGISGQMTSSETMRIGNYNNTVSNFYFNKGYVTQACMIESKSIQQGDFAVSDFLDTFTFGTNGSQIIPKKDSDIAALASAAGGNSFCLNFSSASVALSSGITPTSNAGTFSGSLSNLTDGNFTTDWRSNVDPATNVDNDHIAFDLGSAKDVKAVKVTGRSSITGNFKVQFSDNGSDFTDTGTTFSNVSITTTANSGILDLTSDNPGSHRYWKLINISNSSGTSAWGFKQIILDSAVGNLGTDASGNGNDFTLTSIDSNNQSGNTPSNSYPIWNPLEPTNSTLSFSEGNLRATGSGGSDGGAIGTIPLPTSGTSEFQIKANDGDGRVGIIALDGAVGVDEPSNNCAGGVGINFNAAYHYSENGQVRRVLSSGNTNVSGFDSWSTNDVITVRYNADANELNFLRNNSAVGSTISTEAGLVYYPVVCRFNDYDITAFFDSSKFPHTIGTGNLEVSSANQTAPSYQGIDYFDITLYEGNGTGQRVGDFVPFTDTYTVAKSAMFEHDDKRYLSFTPDSGGNQKTFTVSFWFKLTGASDPSNVQSVMSVGTTGGKQAQIRFEGSVNSQNLNINAYNGSSFLLNLDTDRKFAPSDGWTHAVFAVDTRAGVATANKVKIYIDGVQQTATGTQLSTDDYDTLFNSNQEHQIGRQTNNAIGEPDIYFAEMVMVEDQQLDPTSFGQVDTSTNRWVPKDVSGLTFGDEGWYLEFDGTGFGSGGSGETPANGAGKDSSGNNNHWEEENDSGSDWATTDQFADTPSKNFNVFNHGLNAMGTLTEGNTKIATTTNNKLAYTTMNIPSTGKWYWEVDMTSYASGGGAYFGLHEYNELNTGSAGVTAKAVIFQNYNGTANVYDSSNTDVTWCNSVSNNGFVSSGDVLQFALDQDAGTLFIGNNNTWFRAGGARDTFANATTVGAVKFPTGISRRFFVGRGGSFAEAYALNFGQQANTFSGSSTTFNAAADGFFVYAPPTGYKALNQDNLDDTASKLTAWAWIKNRDASSDHMLIDRVRGIGKDIHSNSDAVEATNANTVQRFLQRGVQVGNDSTVNTAGNSFVLWQWLAGDSATTGTVFPADNPPSLASTVIAADADHFSVGTYTGDGGTSATIKHGLTAAPEMIWVKNRSVADEWMVGTEYNSYSNPWNYYAHLTTTGTFAANSNAWNNTAPTSSVFTVGTSDRVNASGENYVFYCFRSVPGVCKVGQYATNNTSDNGPYIPLGFKPRWIMFHGATASVSQWTLYDTGKEPFNVNDHIFQYANLNSSDQAFASNDIDMLSDGIKIRSDAGSEPNDAGVFTYLAMADIGGGGTLPPIYSR